MSRNRILAVLTVMVVLSGALALVFVNKGASVASVFHDCRSIRVLADAAKQRGDAHEAYYRQEEANVCEGKAPTAKLPPTPSPTSSTSTLPPTSPKTSTAGTPSASPTTKSTHADYTFYAWYSEKDGVNNFGPKVAMDPSLLGMPMQKMNLAQAKQELKYRYHRDTMLSASTGCAFKLWSCSPSTLQSKTQRFMKSPSAWNTAKAAIDRKVEGKASVKMLPAGTYVSTYALNGGNFPEVFSDEVHRTSNLEALVFQNGPTLRLICGFQIYWTLPQAPAPKLRPQPLPKPSPGMTRTQEGVPEKLVWVCNPATGKQIQVPVSDTGKYPPNTGKCKPVTTTSTSSTTTPGTPTSTSTPPPPSSTSTPPPSSTTTTTPPTSTSTPPPPPSSSSMPPKCPPGDTDPACHSLPPGSSGTPTNNPPSLEPVPTHTGPTYNPTKTSTPTASSTTSSPRPTPPNEGPGPTSTTATGGPTKCAVCG